MTYYDNSKRNLEPIKELAGRVFVRELKSMPVQVRPLPQPPVKPPVPAIGGVQVQVSTGKAPRPSCFDCGRKHIAKAIIQLGEAKLGYPQHFWLAIGNLSEAEEEILEYPEIAVIIRTERLNIQANRDHTPNLMYLFDLIDNAEKGVPMK